MRWTAADTDASIPEAFARQVRDRPGAPAAMGIEWSPSFAELDGAANAIARSVLDRAGEGAGRVALMLRHDAPVLAAALGVLKAGKTATVLNPTDPPARLAQLRADVVPELVIADSRHRDRALAAGFDPGECLQLPDLGNGASALDPGIAPDPNAPAFLIYTSGTTGRPKGVVHSHRTILHNVLRQTNGIGIAAEDRIALPASLSGAQGLASSWIGLLNGATMCPFPIAERGAVGLTAWLADREITVMVASASVFRGCARALDGARLPAIRLLRLGSEAVRWEDVEIGRRHCAPDCTVAVMYSSSEAGNITQHLIGPDVDEPPGPLSVGRAGEGIAVRVVDERGETAPPGALGEILVTGEFLSLGYWGQEELTAERFAPSGDGGSSRTLRTGDVGSLDEDGALIITGRRDRTLKMRGNRVDPSEIEAALALHPAVESAAVHPVTGRRGEASLAAYVAVSPGADPSSASLRSHVRETLPEHAVPATFTFVDQLPLSPTGAVEHDRLVTARPPGSNGPPKRPARSATERTVAEAWSEVLELDSVGRDDEFYELGGDSLAAAIAAARIHSATGAELELASFVEAPTVAAMAALVDRLRATGHSARRPPLERVPREGPLPASFNQELAWRVFRRNPGSRFFAMSGAVRIAGSLDVKALRASVDHIVRRHEPLRTSLSERDGAVVQVVHPAAPVELPLVDLSGEPDPAGAAAALADREAARGFDLEQSPLIRLRLVRLGGSEHLLLRCSHHAISDAESWSVFFGELAELYDAYRRGLSPPLPDELTLKYADYAAWERRWLAPGSPHFEAEVGWWRERLADAPRPAPLQLARSTPATGRPPEDGVIACDLDPEVARALERIARAERTTPFAVRQTLLAAQLAIGTDRDEVVLTTFVRNRRELAVQRMFGWFANAVTLRLRLDRGAGFREWLRDVRDQAGEAGAHTAIPSQRLIAALAEGGVRVPPAQAIVAVINELSPVRFAGVELTPVPRSIDAMPVGFGLHVAADRPERGEVRFDANVYDPDRVRAFVERSQMLAAAAAESER